MFCACSIVCLLVLHVFLYLCALFYRIFCSFWLGSRKWFSVCRKLFPYTSIVCGRCSWCRSFPTDVGCNGENAPKRMFLTFLFGHQEMAIQFLKDVGHIPSRVQCNIYERDMTWTADLTRNDGFRWRCRRSVAGVRCRGTASFRHGSWFWLSNLTLLEIITMTYILRRDSAHPNQRRT